MDKLSIVEKAKRYDEAIKKLRSLHDDYDTVSTLIDVKEELENIFPELAESEGERVKKAIFGMVYESDNELWSSYDVSKSDVLAWLEKHSQVKEFPISQHKNKTCKENDDSLTSEDERIKEELISNFKEAIENIRSEEIIPHSAKVLVCKMQKWIAWLEKQGEHANFRNKIQIGDKVTRNEDGILVNLSQLNRVAKKDEKQGEHKETLCDKCKKEQPSHSCQDITALGRCALEKQGEQKPYGQREECLDCQMNYAGECKGICALKRNKQKSAEWSEEDKKLIDDTCHLINTLASGYGEKVTEPITFSGTQMIASIKDRLRALVDNRPRLQWKPSDEQIKAVKLARSFVVDDFYEHPALSEILIELEEQLKKLKD